MTPAAPYPTDPVPTPGSLVHNAPLPSRCVACGWRGVPTRTGGARVGRPRRYFVGYGAGHAVQGSSLSHLCPACEETGSAEFLADARPPLRSSGREVRTVRRGPRVGRNDPCGCGSGRKFKRCCGA